MATEGRSTVLGPSPTRSAGVRWDDQGLDRRSRRAFQGRGGAVVWLTGLPSAGKSTVAGAVEQHLMLLGHPAYRLDGDNLRHGLNGDLGFSPADRAESVRRTGHAAALLADAGLIVLVSLVSPFAADRDAARATVTEVELPFFEIWVRTPLAVCEDRDPKGLYARARAGELRGMTGIDDPYEPPAAPELVIDGTAPITQAMAEIVGELRAQGLLGR